jgi:hypothetical protein
MQQADDNKGRGVAAVERLLEKVLAKLEEKPKEEKSTEKELANLREGTKKKKLVRTSVIY